MTETNRAMAFFIAAATIVWSTGCPGDADPVENRDASDSCDTRPDPCRSTDCRHLCPGDAGDAADTDGDTDATNDDAASPSDVPGTGVCRRDAIERAPEGTDEFTQTVDFEYDEEGNLDRKVVYLDGDDEPDEITTFDYQEGRRVRTSLDGDADGEAEFVEEFEYDESGKLVRVSQDVNGDGDAESAWSFDYEQGRKVRKEKSPVDSDELETVVTYEYEDDELHREFWDHDGVDGADGEPDYVIRYQYEEGRRIRKSFDRDFDDEAEEIIHFEYDAGGKLVRKEYDRDGDGTAEAVDVYEYTCNR